MRLNIFLSTAVSLLLSSLAAVQAQPQHGFRITFSDKRGTKDFSNPTDLLTQRALDRRTAQGIALDSTDLPVSPIYTDSVLKLTEGKMHLTSRWLNQCVILLNDSAKILTLQGQAFITNIEYIAYYTTPLHLRIAADTNVKISKEAAGEAVKGKYKTTGTEAFYGMTWQQTKTVNGNYLHDRGYMGQGKLIAVCDEGFQFADTNPGFDSLRNSGRLVDRHNFNTASDNVYVQGGHGTASLSTMAGYIPGVYVGAAPLAQYALYNTEYPGEQPIEMDNMVAAMERADSIGADIITVSLGYNVFEAPIPFSLTYQQIDGHTTQAAKGANMATRKGILFVASAGNEGGNSQWPYILTPGDADSAITVGSVDPNQVPASNSGYGPNSSGRIKPDVCMVGQPVVILDIDETPRAASGTSFATPQLAGWAACLWQTVSTGTPDKLKNAIRKSASFYTNPTNRQLGYGVPDFGKAADYLDVKDTPKAPTNWAWIQSNPVGSEILLHLDQTHTGNVAVRITDISGRTVYSEERKRLVGVHSIPFSAAGLSSGVYFFTIVSDGRQMTIKLVKN